MTHLDTTNALATKTFGHFVQRVNSPTLSKRIFQ